MGTGPVRAVRKALKRAGLKIEQIDLWELNEAFASQSVACIRELRLDPATVNIYGGAIALGHALGSSGSRMMTTLVHVLVRRKARYGVATVWIGVGQGIAVEVRESLATLFGPPLVRTRVETSGLLPCGCSAGNRNSNVRAN